MEKNYSRSGFVALLEYLPPEKFRLIPKSVLDKPHGRTEILVQIDIYLRDEEIDTVLEGKKMAEVYETLYGYIKDNDKITEVFSGIPTLDDKNKKIRLRDAKDRFLLIFEDGSGYNEITCFVIKPEVEELLDSCLKPNPL